MPAQVACTSLTTPVTKHAVDSDAPCEQSSGCASPCAAPASGCSWRRISLMSPLLPLPPPLSPKISATIRPTTPSPPPPTARPRPAPRRSSTCDVLIRPPKRMALLYPRDGPEIIRCPGVTAALWSPRRFRQRVKERPSADHHGGGPALRHARGRDPLDGARHRAVRPRRCQGQRCRGVPGLRDAQ